METVYDVELSVVSDFDSYSEIEMRTLIKEIIENYTDPCTGLKLRVSPLVFVKRLDT